MKKGIYDDMSTPSRRSQRARKKTVDIYQAELDTLAEKQKTKTPPKKYVLDCSVAARIVFFVVPLFVSSFVLTL